MGRGRPGALAGRGQQGRGSFQQRGGGVEAWRGRFHSGHAARVALTGRAAAVVAFVGAEGHGGVLWGWVEREGSDVGGGVSEKKKKVGAEGRSTRALCEVHTRLRPGPGSGPAGPRRPDHHVKRHMRYMTDATKWSRHVRKVGVRGRKAAADTHAWWTTSLFPRRTRARNRHALCPRIPQNDARHMGVVEGAREGGYAGNSAADHPKRARFARARVAATNARGEKVPLPSPSRTHRFRLHPAQSVG